jgi:hypothetical protein
MNGHTRLVLPMDGSHGTQLITNIPISADEARTEIIALDLL